MQGNRSLSLLVILIIYASVFLSLSYTLEAKAGNAEPQSGELELTPLKKSALKESPSEPFPSEQSPSNPLPSETNKTKKTYGLQLDSKAKMSINGMVATIELEQHFQNPSEYWVEGRYVFPLPEDAAVNAMEIHIGERIIKASIKEKQQAKKIYKAAKAAGKKTGLLEQHRPNLFSQKVANIGPNETIVVKLRYIQTVAYQDETFSLRFPMTITPRYIPGNAQRSPVKHSPAKHSPVKNSPAKHTQDHRENKEEQTVHINQEHGWGWANNTSEVNDASLITPPMIENNSTETHIVNPIELTIQLDAGLPLAAIDSAYHSISVSKTGSQHTIKLSKGRVSMDRDFVLSWQAVASATPKAAMFNETIDGDDYSLVMLMPPKKNTPQDKQQSIPTETIFIIDTSGSMGGTSIKQAKTGLAYALGQLSEQDKFNIIEFNSHFSTLYPRPRLASENNINQALSFVGRLRADGGTEMLPALKAAFKQAHEKQHLKQIIFITDGSIGNEATLFDSIHQELGEARLFTVGIGSAPNSFFMRKAAEFGRGSFTYIGDINEVNKKMQALFGKINKPMMQDITIEDTQGQPLDIFPNPIPDLYQGEPIVVAIRKDYETESLIIKGSYNQEPWKKIMTFNHGKNHTGVGNIWARKKIEALLDKKRVDKEITQEKQDNIKNNIIKVALRHQLMSPYTSFVAVEDTTSRPSSETLDALKKQAVANVVAKGQSLQNVHYPQTATSLWFNLLLGFIALIAATFLQFKKAALLFSLLNFNFKNKSNIASNNNRLY